MIIMDEKTKAFLEYMLDDYMDCCEQDFVNDEDFPFSQSELAHIRIQLNKLVGRE